MNTKSWNEIVQMVAQAVEKAKPGQWIIGRGWHQEKWSSTPAAERRGVPDARVARQGLAEQPGASSRTRAATRRSRTRRRSSFPESTAQTANPEGGEILKDKSGTADGPASRDGVATHQTRRRRADADAGGDAKPASGARSSWPIRKSISKGSRAFRTPGRRSSVVNRVKRLIDEGRMRVRLWMMVREYDPQSLAANRVIGYGNNRLTVRAIKITADGALGSRGAWLLEPYSDLPEGSVPASTSRVGLPSVSMDLVRKRAQTALELGYQMCIHAIGDRANREVLNIYEETFKRNNRIGKRSALAHRARAAHQRRRHSPVRPARRHRLDAGRALHVGRPLGRRRASAPSAPKKARTSGRSS